jgi:hypothetical protein
MVTLLATTATTFFAIGFSLAAIYFSSENPNPDFYISAIIIVILGLGLFTLATIQARISDNKRLKQMDTLIEELKGFRKDFIEKRK